MFDQIHHIVEHIWPAPHHARPAISYVHPNNKTALAQGSRLKLSFREVCPTWVIIHEVAHALTQGDRHGPDFVGAYVQMLNKHLGIQLPEMIYTLKHGRVKFNLTCPAFDFLKHRAWSGSAILAEDYSDDGADRWEICVDAA